VKLLYAFLLHRIMRAAARAAGRPRALIETEKYCRSVSDVVALLQGLVPNGSLGLRAQAYLVEADPTGFSLHLGWWCSSIPNLRDEYGASHSMLLWVYVSCGLSRF